MLVHGGLQDRLWRLLHDRLLVGRWGMWPALAGHIHYLDKAVSDRKGLACPFSRPRLQSSAHYA